jgi:hypothetical protein
MVVRTLVVYTTRIGHQTRVKPASIVAVNKGLSGFVSQKEAPLGSVPVLGKGAAAFATVRVLFQCWT